MKKFKPEIINGKKNCKACGEFLPLSEYYYKLSKIGNDTYSSECRGCVKNRLSSKIGEKICAGCSKNKSYSEFTLNGRSHNRFCKYCLNAQVKNKYKSDPDYKKARLLYCTNYRVKNQDKCNERVRKWIKRNPEKYKNWKERYKPVRYKLNEKYRIENRETIREYANNKARVSRENLDDYYISSLLKAGNVNIIPPQLIRLKRTILKAQRTLKIIENGSRTTTQ